jgi:hypothetical protein
VPRGAKPSDAVGASAMLHSPGVFALAASLIHSVNNPKRSGMRVAGPITFVVILQIYSFRRRTKEKLDENFSQSIFPKSDCLFITHVNTNISEELFTVS